MRGEHARLALETEDRSVNVGLAAEHAGVIDEVARGKVVGPIDDDVEVAEQLQGVGAGQTGFKLAHVDVGIDRRNAIGGRVQFLAPDVCGAMNHLPLQVGHVHNIEVDDT